MWLTRSMKLQTSIRSSLSARGARRYYKGRRSKKRKSESKTTTECASSGTWERRPFDEVFCLLSGITLFRDIGDSCRKSESQPGRHAGCGNSPVRCAQRTFSDRVEGRIGPSGKLNESIVRFFPSLEQESPV